MTIGVPVVGGAWYDQYWGVVKPEGKFIGEPITEPLPVHVILIVQPDNNTVAAGWNDKPVIVCEIAKLVGNEVDTINADVLTTVIVVAVIVEKCIESVPLILYEHVIVPVLAEDVYDHDCEVKLPAGKIIGELIIVPPNGEQLTLTLIPVNNGTDEGVK